MTRFHLCLVALTAAICAAGSAKAVDDSTYPVSASAQSSYLLSGDSVATDQTLQITRILRNSGSYPITGIYFAENIPPEFSLDSVDIEYNGAPAAFQAIGPNADEIEAGYSCYRWMVDSPDPASPLQLTLNPGDSVVLTLTISCATVGSYTLPLHSLAGYGNGAGFFTTSQPVYVAFTDPADSTPPAQINDLQVQLTTP